MGKLDNEVAIITGVRVAFAFSLLRLYLAQLINISCAF